MRMTRSFTPALNLQFQAPRPFHLSHRERSKSSFMISGEGFSPTSCPHPNFGKRNSTSPGGRGEAAGFSLIELAIVLVILGLLVGGIMSGQSLIRAAELRSITMDLERYQSAVITFRVKHSHLPGDMTNATTFWGTAPICAGGTGAFEPGTCNGNGNNLINIAVASGFGGQTGEMFQFWKHLSLAGLIEGSYTGISGADQDTSIIGINVPASKVSGTGWSIISFPETPSASSYFNYDYSTMNRLMIGRQTPLDVTSTAAFRPAEAYNIDTKVDDGKPGRGKMIIMRVNTCTDTSDPNNLDASYLLTSNNIGCVVMFVDFL
jgi:prepilin-type N-terminal cleavage/methylation domain-containing protein